jgi:hypothetical protein
MKTKTTKTFPNISEDNLQIIKVVNYESDEVPLWAENFGNDSYANLLFFAMPRDKRYGSWIKYKHVIISWEYDNLISIRKNGDVVFTWKSEQEYIAFLLKWL